MSSASLEKPRLTGEIVGGVLLALGIVVSFSVARAGVDFPSLYVMGEGIAHGVNVYDQATADALPGRFDVARPPGMFYPPATGVMLAPLAFLPYGAAKMAWFVVMAASIVFGARALCRVAAPEGGRALWLASSGILLLASATRWGMLLLQGAPLVLGLLCLFVGALHGASPRLALVIAAAATALKMTLAVPFMVLLLVHRRYGAIAASIATWLVLNALGFLRMGSGSFDAYQRNMKVVEALGGLNSPDPFEVRSAPRIDWSSLFYAVTHDVTVSRVATLALTALVGLWLLYEIYRSPPPVRLPTSTAFLGVAVCLGSLCVYHHEYDASLFLVPLLLGCVVFRRDRPPIWALILVAPLAVTLLMMPFGKTRDFLGRTFGDVAIAFLKMSFPVLFTLALVGCLGVLRWLGPKSSVTQRS